MAKKMYYYNVKNRSAGAVLYTIPEDNIRRRFAPGETKRISYEELLHLSYQFKVRESPKVQVLKLNQNII